MLDFTTLQIGALNESGLKFTFVVGIVLGLLVLVYASIRGAKTGNLLYGLLFIFGGMLLLFSVIAFAGNSEPKKTVTIEISNPTPQVMESNATSISKEKGKYYFSVIYKEDYLKSLKTKENLEKQLEKDFKEILEKGEYNNYLEEKTKE